LKSGIEALSGHSMDDVKVHYNSAKPTKLDAHAYAQGAEIHLAPGQEKHLPHEAWHVVQQKQGRVKPTIQMKGKVQVNDEKVLEDEADLMGHKAIQFVDNRRQSFVQKELLNNIQNINADEVSQLVKIKTAGEPNRPRFINPSRRRPGVKKAQWLQLLETKGKLIEEAGLTIDEALSLKKHIAANGQDGMLDDYLKLAVLKGLSFEVLLGMVSEAKATSNRGYPAPFTNLDQYHRFKNSITRIARVIGVRFTEIRVQGSAVRKKNPNDIDIGIMVSKAEFTRLTDVIQARLVRLNIGANDRAKKQFDKGVEKGRFGIRDLAILGEEHTGALVQVIRLCNEAMFNAVGGKKNAIPVQASVILIGGSFDSKPYMVF